MKILKQFVIVWLGTLILVLGAPEIQAEFEKLDSKTMSSITAKEGFEIQFNLLLGSEFQNPDENLHLNVGDGDCEASDCGGDDDRANLAAEGIWLEMDIGGSNSNHSIGLDTVYQSGTPALQLSMDENDEFADIEGKAGVTRNSGNDIPHGLRLKYGETGGGGVNTLGIGLGSDWSGGSGAGMSGTGGSLDFDGNLHIWGAGP